MSLNVLTLVLGRAHRGEKAQTRRGQGVRRQNQINQVPEINPTLLQGKHKWFSLSIIHVT